MKKLIYILMCSPIIFLTSCSSGGGDSSPSPSSLLVGQWMQTSLEMDLRYYQESNITILDTSIVWDVDDILDNIGTLVGYEVNGDGTYEGYSSDGFDIWLDTTGVWSATSTMLTVDGENFGTYVFVGDNLIISENDVIAEEIEPGLWIDATNIKSTFASINLGVTSNSHSKKKAPGIKQLLIKKFD